MKLILPITELILYIGVGVLITLLMVKKLTPKVGRKVWMLIGLILVLMIFPLISGIDYYLQLNIPVFEELAAFGFVISSLLINLGMFFLPIFIINLIIVKCRKNRNITPQKMKFKWFLLVLLTLNLSVIFTGFGYFCTQNYSKTAIKLKNSQINGLRIVAVSDTHYGTTCSTLNTAKLVDEVNALNPDVVFLLGDVFDNHISALNKQDFTLFVDGFKSTYGTYAILGNHELKQNSYQDAVSFYSDSNVKLLLDEEVIINNEIRVIGRIDDQYNNKDRKRKNLDEIASNSSLPLMVLDHKPDYYKEAKNIGAFIQYSGHTHNGQIAPYNLLLQGYCALVSKCPIQGITKYGDFNLVICRGSGTWGFPIKTTGSAEIINIYIDK